MSERESPSEYCDTAEPLKERLVTLPMMRNGRWYIFENVPALVCRHCGHRYYDGPMLLNLEQMIDEEIEQARPIEAYAFSLPLPTE